MGRNNKIEISYEGVNHNLLNIITPTCLEFLKTQMLISDNHVKALVLSRYPTNSDYGWLSKIANMEGTIVKMEFTPTESGPLIERCNEQIKLYNMDLNENLEESVRQSKTKAIEDIRKMISRVSINGEVVGYLCLLILVQASTQEKLNERVKSMQAIIASLNCGTRHLTNLQKEAYLSAAPYGRTDEVIKSIGDRNMPLSTFIGGFPYASSGINDGTGFILGKTDESKLVIIDTSRRGNDRINSNWFVSGVPGVGKSTVVKLISIIEYAFGAKLIFLDPEKEYQDLVNNLQGKIIKCGGGKGGRINPLQVRSVPIDDESGDDNGVSELAQHMSEFRTFMRLYRREMSQEELDKLEEILEKTYARFNIKYDTDVSRMKPKEFPIFADLYEDILEDEKKDTDNVLIKKLALGLRSISIGADSHIFNGHTDITMDGDSIIDLDISRLLEGDRNILQAQMHNINSWVWKLATADRNETVFYVVDEGYLIVDPEVPEPLIFVKNYSKRIRKYNGGIMFITHAVTDVLDPAVKRHGQALIDNACYKMLMGTDGQNFAETNQLFSLTEAEQELLSAKQRGRGLLFAGSKRTAIRIEVPQALLELMGSAGGR